MNKVHYNIILYVILIMLARMREASQLEVVSTVTEGEPIEKLSAPIIKIILEYLDIQSGFKFLFQKAKFYDNHRTVLTEVATAHYSRLFIYPYERFLKVLQLSFDEINLSAQQALYNDNAELLSLLHQYKKFFQTTRFDPPDPPLRVFCSLLWRPDPPILCADLRDHPETTEAIIVNFPAFLRSKYKRTDDDDGNSAWTIDSWLHFRFSFPVTYDPVRNIFRFHPISTDETGCWEYMRLPIILSFVGETTCTHHVDQWELIGWTRSTNQNDNDDKSNTLRWILKHYSDWWILKYFILKNGVVDIIILSVNNEDKNVFRTVDEGKTYVLDNCSPNVYYKTIEAIYYPEHK